MPPPSLFQAKAIPQQGICKKEKPSAPSLQRRICLTKHIASFFFSQISWGEAAKALL
jgi:hypothetical protein